MVSAFIKEMGRGLVHMLYPALCDGCSKQLVAGEEVLCIACDMQLPETRYHHIKDNETELRFAGRIPFLHATSFAWFTAGGLLQHVVHGLKYEGKQNNGAYLGRRLGTRLRQVAWSDTIDVIIPVPLHNDKLRKRGYNQSTLIGQGIGRELNVPVAENLLRRTRNTESQTKKTRIERVENMASAFAVVDHSQLAGKHVLLCDDVLTTGATIEACALALMAVNDIKISIVTIGIAVS